MSLLPLGLPVLVYVLPYGSLKLLSRVGENASNWEIVEMLLFVVAFNVIWPQVGVGGHT